MTRLSYSTYLCLLHSTSVKFSNSTEKMLLYDRFFDNAYAFTHIVFVLLVTYAVYVSVSYMTMTNENKVYTYSIISPVNAK